MLPIHQIIWHEMTTPTRPPRQPEPVQIMDDIEQVRSYVHAYEWGGPTSALQLHHLRELAGMIRPADTVLDLACGPGPLLLELAQIYTECKFIGVDLSATMLQHLRQEASARALNNITILREDIRSLPSLDSSKVDLVIATSALHHLPDEPSLRQVFERIRSILTANGGFYLFDFGLLRSRRARELFVAEVAKLAEPLTVKDYDLSLQAAFPIGVVFQLARDELPRPFVASSSALVDIFYTLRSQDRAVPTERAVERINQVRSSLGISAKMEHALLRFLRTSTNVS